MNNLIKNLLTTYDTLDTITSGTEALKPFIKALYELDNALLLSKMSSLSSADATKYLTTVTNAYESAAEDTLGIISKLAAVNTAADTSIGTLAKGLNETADSASHAGISLEKLLGYLAAVQKVSHKNIYDVGNSFNAIFSRLENLNQMEPLLQNEGIVLTDSSDTYRNLGDIIDEVAGKWSSYSEASQQSIASAFAGQEHMKDWIMLMENYDNALQYTEAALQSSGQSLENFSAYQDSLTGHTEKLKSAYEELAQEMASSDFLKAATDGGAELLKVLTGIVDNFGILVPLLAGTGISKFVKNLDCPA